MKRLVSVLGLFVCCRVFAAPDGICSGDPQLSRLEGYWALSAFSEKLAKTRSWGAALTEDISPVASLKIGRNRISFNLNWHERDSTEGNCVRWDGIELWARPIFPKEWVGPYVRAPVRSTEDEAAYFLGKYFTGCFISDHREQWCLSPRGITVDRKALPTELQMDIVLAPKYGTVFKIARRSLPLIVFVPRNDGWDIFEDDWIDSDVRVPVDPSKSKPWRRLKK